MRIQDLTCSIRCQSLHLAAILRYYRTKTDNAPQTLSKLVGTIIEDFYISLANERLLVPFESQDVAKDYLNTEQRPTKAVNQGIKISHVKETEKRRSVNKQANELFEKLEE